MKDLLLPLAILPSIMPANAGEAETWWTIAQRNGVGFVFFVLFLALTAISVRREKVAEQDRVKRENDANAERLALQTEIRDLNKQQLDQAAGHSSRLEKIIKDGNKAQADVGIEMKNLARRVRCPGAPIPPASNDASIS